MATYVHRLVIRLRLTPRYELTLRLGEAIVRFEDTSGKLRVLKILEPIQQTNSDGVDVPEIKEGFLMPFLDVRTNTLSERARLRWASSESPRCMWRLPHLPLYPAT